MPVMLIPKSSCVLDQNQIGLPVNGCLPGRIPGELAEAKVEPSYVVGLGSRDFS